MKILKHGLLLSTLAVTSIAMACSIDGKEGFLPENDMYISADDKSAGGITEYEFNQVIDKAEAIYTPIIASYGANLKVERNWSDGTVNAYAQQIGKTWRVAMFGGLARHNTITADGFALVLCHEIGHHIGGSPKKATMWGNAWASNEGQADYFANLKCLRRLWQDEDNTSVVAKMNVPKAVTDACGQQFVWNQDYNICVRGTMAGYSVANLFGDRSTTAPDVLTPDPRVVTTTDHNHPDYQCRLDTYFQGSLCHIDYTQDVSQSDEFVGTCNIATGDVVGNRPHCWFKPQAQ